MTAYQDTQQAIRILRLKQVLEITGLSRSTVYDILDPDSPRHDASFPSRIYLTPSSVGWVASEINAWIESRIKQSRPYSFDMGNDIQQKLKKLAEGYDLPINITLEAIIRDSAQFKEKLRAEQKANLEKMKLDFQDKEEKLQLQKAKQHTVTERNQREIELQYKLIEDLLDKNFKKDLIFRAKKITDYAISEDEELQVMEQVEKELNDLKKEIKKEVNKISSLEHLMTYDVIPH
ncbi:MAG: AlpA family phage regulatory protein [Gammaproteobacteria bacterium]|nr:AlpA family phage regulatory protein [Gammaproteobacteria bacterium]